jgi:two-component system phosphate regulon sensor histidine kinase PhoR
MPFHARVVKENGTIFWQSLSTKIDQEVEIFKANLFPEDALEQEYFLQVSFADNRKYLLGSMWSMLAISVLLLAVIIGLFIFSFSTIYRQRQLSELKSDFINNMTHELKTPIATISLACEVLQDDDVVKSEMSRDRYIKMIKEENTRLGMLVENVLRTSLFEQGQLKMKLQEVNVHEVIQTVLKSFDLQFKSRRAMIDDQLDSVSPIIEGDILHITNMVYNLVDNALKYSLENPELKISTRDEGGFFVMEISDKGLGISKENQKRIFEKLYRVPTGNVHNVKGYGLGLSYVLGVVTKHLGTIKVDSELKK